MSVAGSHLCPFSARPVTKHQPELFTFCLLPHLQAWSEGDVCDADVSRMVSNDVISPPNHILDIILSKGLTLVHQESTVVSSSSHLRSLICMHLCGHVEQQALGGLRRSPPCKNSLPADWCCQILPVSFIVNCGRHCAASSTDWVWAAVHACRPAGECTTVGSTLSGCGLQSMWRCTVRISVNQPVLFILPCVCSLSLFDPPSSRGSSAVSSRSNPTFEWV